MTTLTPELTVGQIAATQPASIRIFEKYRIDYCCGGRIPLDEACVQAGVNPSVLLQEIEAATAATPNTTDWQNADLDELIDHILRTHHAYMKTELPRLEAMLAKVASVHGDRLPPLAPVFGPLKDELEGHLMKEEMVLFPLMRTLVMADRSGIAAPPAHCGSVRNPLRVMLMEHDHAGDALGELRRLTNDYALPEGACNTFRALYQGLADMEADLHQHIHLENNVLFPRAVALEK